MEIGTGVFCTLITLLLVFNTFLLIGIAGSVAKLIRSIQGGEDLNNLDKWSQIIRQRRSLHMNEANLPSYADTVGLHQQRQIAAQASQNWDGVSRRSNWDGIPETDDDE